MKEMLLTVHCKNINVSDPEVYYITHEMKHLCPVALGASLYRDGKLDSYGSYESFARESEFGSFATLSHSARLPRY